MGHHRLTIGRLNLVKIRFSENAFFIFFFTGGAFIIVNHIIKLVLEFQFALQNPRKQQKCGFLKIIKITVFNKNWGIFIKK